VTSTTELGSPISACGKHVRRGINDSTALRETLAHVTALLRFPRNRWWYVAAALLAVLGWCAAVSWEADGWDVLRSAKVTPLGAPIEASGKDVGVFTDYYQSGRTINCVSVGANNKTTPIAPSPVDMQVVSGGTSWHLLALSTDGTASMTIQCTPTDKLTDSAVYGTAVVADANSRTGTPLAWLFAALAAGLAAATAWGRHTA
jgi:hypothetical protein